MIEQNSLKRLTLRATLRHVSPMVIRLMSVSDRIDLPDFNDIFCAVLGWSGQMGYILRVLGQVLARLDLLDEPRDLLGSSDASHVFLED